MDYETTGNVLVERIRSLVPANPQILSMKDAWDLFSVKEFDCSDILPSYAQAAAALAVVQRDAAKCKP